jgi:hypothetical protein
VKFDQGNLEQGEGFLSYSKKGEETPKKREISPKIQNP